MILPSFLTKKDEKEIITRNIILYLIKKLGKNIEGRKKLMKLMFLIEYFDPNKGKIVKKKTIGNRFYIYYYGVFSFEVMKTYEELVKEGKIIDEFPIKLKEDVKIELEDNLKEHVEKIINTFGKKSGFELEIETLKMMNIDPSEKEKYFGKEIEEIIK